MGLETADTIAELDPLWPLGTDPKSQGDDHIRLLKRVLQEDALSLADGGIITAGAAAVVMSYGGGFTLYLNASDPGSGAKSATFTAALANGDGKLGARIRVGGVADPTRPKSVFQVTEFDTDGFEFDMETATITALQGGGIINFGSGIVVGGSYLTVKTFNEGTYGAGEGRFWFDPSDAEFNVIGRDGADQAIDVGMTGNNWRIEPEGGFTVTATANGLKLGSTPNGTYDGPSLGVTSTYHRLRSDRTGANTSTAFYSGANGQTLGAVVQAEFDSAPGSAACLMTRAMHDARAVLRSEVRSRLEALSASATVADLRDALLEALDAPVDMTQAMDPEA